VTKGAAGTTEEERLGLVHGDSRDTMALGTPSVRGGVGRDGVHEEEEEMEGRSSDEWTVGPTRGGRGGDFDLTGETRHVVRDGGRRRRGRMSDDDERDDFNDDDDDEALYTAPVRRPSPEDEEGRGGSGRTRAFV
jgi:hypothetical protein